MNKTKNFKRASIVMAFLLLAGPFVLLIGGLLGGDMWDGFAGGGRSNNNLHDQIFDTGMWVWALGGIAAVVYTIIEVVRGFKYDKRLIMLPFISVIAPFVLLFVSLMINASITICSQPSSGCVNVER